MDCVLGQKRDCCREVDIVERWLLAEVRLYFESHQHWWTLWVFQSLGMDFQTIAPRPSYLAPRLSPLAPRPSPLAPRPSPLIAHLSLLTFNYHCWFYCFRLGTIIFSLFVLTGQVRWNGTIFCNWYNSSAEESFFDCWISFMYLSSEFFPPVQVDGVKISLFVNLFGTNKTCLMNVFYYCSSFLHLELISIALQWWK